MTKSEPNLVAAAAVVRDGRVLATRRTHPADVAGRWELPGGKVEADESVADAVVREVREELGCSVVYLRALSGRAFVKPGYQLTTHLVQLASGEPIPREHDAVRWLAPEELDEVDWLPADRPFLPEIAALLSDGSRLEGGNVGGAVRIGPTVRRPIGAWTPAVHALLGSLRARGLTEVPQVLGVDARGREVLSYLPGRVLDIDSELPSEALLADAMRWLRRFHEAVSEVEVAGPWRTRSGDLGPGELVAHNDFAPYNVAVSTSGDGERLVGVFDWDMAGPATRVDELGFAAWNWVPLWRPMAADQAARRLGVMSAVYGGVGPVRILEGVAPRIRRSIQLIAAGQEAGDPGMLNLSLVGEPQRTAAALAELERRVPQIRQVLLDRHP
jgi:mutator protein MutT